jgi:hypothetical protein
VDKVRYRVTFAVGLAMGYVLGSRAGRERYEQIKRATQRVLDSPAVQEAAGLFGARVSQAAGAARNKAGDVLGDRMPFLGKDHTGDYPDSQPSRAGGGWTDATAETRGGPNRTQIP